MREKNPYLHPVGGKGADIVLPTDREDRDAASEKLLSIAAVRDFVIGPGPVPDD